MTKAFQRSMGDQLVKTLCRLLKDNLKDKYAPNSLHSIMALVQTLIFTACEKTTVEEGATKLRMMTDENTPSPDTVFRRLDQLTTDQIFEIFDIFTQYTLRRAKKKGFLKGPVNVAIDGHDEPFYGKKRPPAVRGTKKARGTNWAFQYLVADIVVDGERFTLAILPVPSLANEARLLKSILKKIRAHVEVDTILLDRGFFSVDEIMALEDAHVKFMMPAIRNERVKGFIKANMAYRYSIDRYTMGARGHTATMNIVMVPSPRKKKEMKDRERLFVYITNREVTEATMMEWVDIYDKRWGIETGFRVRRKFWIRTNTPNVDIRYFFFLLAAMLYNFWLLANILKGWKPNPHYDYAILAREFRWALECFIPSFIRPDG